jgi:hypothetical protein
VLTTGGFRGSDGSSVVRRGGQWRPVATPPSRPLDAVLSPSPFEADGCDIRAEEIPASLPGCWVGHRAIHCLCWLYGGRRWLVPRAISPSSLVAGGPGVRTASVQDYFKRRARNWRAQRFRVNAPGPPAGAFAFCATRTRFCDKGCVRGGLLGWASSVAWPSAWPTLGEVSPDCLFAHR